MKKTTHTIQYSTVSANIEGLIKILQADNKLHLLPEIQKQISEYIPDDEDRVPLTQVTKNIKTIANLIDDPNFGCKVINSINLDNIPLFSTLSQCKLIANQDGKKLPINVLITLIARYFSVITEVVTLDIHFYDGSVELVLNPSLPESISYHQVEGVAVGLYRIIDSLSTSKLTRLEFTHNSQSNFDYKSVFKTPAVFSSLMNKMTFSCTDAIDGMNQHTLYTAGNIQKLFDQQFPETDNRTRVKHIIKSTLSFGEPTRENISDILHISVSTLQRKLKGQGSNFKDILLETRKEMAHDLLINHNRNPSELSFLLGYQSCSQFFKAFKSWFGETPSEYKNHNKDSH